MSGTPMAGVIGNDGRFHSPIIASASPFAPNYGVGGFHWRCACGSAARTARAVRWEALASWERHSLRTT